MKQVDEEKNIGETVVDRKTDWRTLRELDAEVAERVMGWTRFPEPMHPTDNRTIDGVLYCPPEYGYDSRGALNCVPYFSTDIKAAMEVEDRIATLGLQKQYLQALGPIVARAATEAGEILGYWHFTHATAEQRCRAALALVDGPQTKEGGSR